MTNDQIIAEAVRLAKEERHQYEPQTLQSVARHALRLATQPEQDPALVKAMAVWDDAHDASYSTRTTIARTHCQASREAAARVIMKHYPAPSAELIDWARETLQGPRRAVEQRLANYILTVAGEKQ